jgi:hypothetical protein
MVRADLTKPKGNYTMTNAKNTLVRFSAGAAEYAAADALRAAKGKEVTAFKTFYDAVIKPHDVPLAARGGGIIPVTLAAIDDGAAVYTDGAAGTKWALISAAGTGSSVGTGEYYELSVLNAMIGENATVIEDGKTRISLGGESTLVLEPSDTDVFGGAITKKWQENPSLMLYKLQANGYKFSWLLIPLSIPFVWLMFAWRRQFKAYDHAVFVTYSLAFMSLLFITMSLLGLIPGGWGNGIAAILLTIGAPLHLYKQLRHAYVLTRFSTLWRFFALLFFINVVIVLFLQALLVLGAF